MMAVADWKSSILGPILDQVWGPAESNIPSISVSRPRSSY